MSNHRTHIRFKGFRIPASEAEAVEELRWVRRQISAIKDQIKISKADEEYISMREDYAQAIREYYKMW